MTNIRLSDSGNKGLKGAAGGKTALSQARRAAYQILARRGHSRLEVREKLQRRGFPPGIVSTVIKELEAGHYLDDRLFALTWAQGAVERRHLGPLAVRTGLRLKGIDREIIEEVLQKVYAEQDEEQVAGAIGRRRLECMQRGGPEGSRRRLAGYLMRKGFTSEVIGKVLRSIGKQPTDTLD